MKYQKIEELVQKHNNQIILAILLIGLLTRILFLEEFPDKMHVDEAGIMYDAYCFSHYGVDRYLNKNPVYLINFGGGQSILYTLITSIFIKLFGYRLFWVRFPQVLFAMCYIWLTYIIVKRWKNKKMAILVAGLITIAPYSIIQSRYALDCNLMAPFTLMGLAMLLYAKKKWQYIIAGILFGVTCYTYILSFLILPIFLIAISLYLLYVKKANIIDIICVAIPVILFALPLLLFLLYNNGVIEINHALVFSYPKLIALRTGEISFQNIGNNMLELLKKFFTIDFITCLQYPEEGFSMFSNFYLISRAFFLIGIGIAIKKIWKERKERKYSLDIVFLILLISGSGLLLLEEIFWYRANAIVICIIYFTALGIEAVIKKCKKLAIPIIVFYMVLFIVFLIYYFGVYAKPKLPEYNGSIANVIRYAESEFQQDSIYVACISYEPYIYELVSNPISPYEFQKDYEIQDRKITRYGKYSFNGAYQNIGENTVCIIKTPDYDKSKLVIKIKESLKSKNYKMERYTTNGDSYEIYYKQRKEEK